MSVDQPTTRKRKKPRPEVDEQSFAIAETIRKNPEILQREEIRTAIAAVFVHQREVFNSPFPDPSQLAEYERINPGATKKILQMAEDSLAFQHYIKGKAQEYGHKKEVEGQRMGFLLAVGCLAASVYLIMHNHSISAMIPVITATAVLIAPFFYKSKEAFQERLSKVKKALGPDNT